ncbi:hypothetical protein QWI17_22680 [Gilvimarinus sp. SDUM040013]|uniref:ABC transporter permease n=1 Tax=Gilvimarinus gilvus TaxID=3058038 RepID=A0ABU4RXC9_9GAMM|nr:hypothetical protein [Gilvimarinus sp. SDUM040013]MDO3388670.1 hypothetical protein [Gilvimarinus sp. SDUM040013]MDX6849565.1 hypothetical protein [Gilvimarinus sp. SDUM040013]
MNSIITQFKREVWESPGIFYKAPIVLFVLIIFLSAISFYSLQNGVVADWDLQSNSEQWSWSLHSEIGSDKQGEDATPQTVVEKISHGQYIIYILFGIGCLFNTINYSLSALVTDRKDRSVLFFKSLPLSEWQVVSTKLVVAVFLLPLAYWLFALATVVAYTIIAGAFAKVVLGADPQVIWQQISFFSTLALSAVGLVLTALWALPMYAIILTFSALARKSPLGLLGAVLMFLWVLEKWIFGTHYLADTLRGYFGGLEIVGQVSFVPLESLELRSNAWRLLAAPGLYIGLAISALCVFAAVWLRDRRFEI